MVVCKGVNIINRMGVTEMSKISVRNSTTPAPLKRHDDFANAFIKR